MLNRRANRCAHLALNTPAARLGAELVGAYAVGWVAGRVAALPMPIEALTRSHMRAPHHMHHTHRSLARRRTATQARPRRPRRHRGHGGGGSDRGSGSILFGRPRERHGRPGCESGGVLLGRSEPPRAGVPRESASATCCADKMRAQRKQALEGPEVREQGRERVRRGMGRNRVPFMNL